MMRCIVATTSGFFQYGSRSYGTFMERINTENVWVKGILLYNIELGNDNILSGLFKRDM